MNKVSGKIEPSVERYSLMSLRYLGIRNHIVVPRMKQSSNVKGSSNPNCLWSEAPKMDEDARII
jgi:hypothetical protein